jgi:hypothetical protein
MIDLIKLWLKPCLGLSLGIIGTVAANSIPNTCIGAYFEQCPTANTLVQTRFDTVIASINNIIEARQYLTDPNHSVQPITVVDNWNGLNQRERAMHLALYGYELQNQLVTPFLIETCAQLKSRTPYHCQAVFQAPQAKDVDRVLEKVPQGAEYNLDYARASVVLDYQAIPYFLNLLQQHDATLDVSIVQNRLVYPTSSHYRDVSIWLKEQQTGFIAELLILGPTMYQEKEGQSHKLYVMLRTYEVKLENLKSSPWTPEVQQQLISLEEKIAALKDNLALVNDKIFRQDAVTACESSTRKTCQDEVQPYVSLFY